MVSKTKYPIHQNTIKELFKAAKIDNITNIEELGAGEYNAVYAVQTPEKAYVLKIAPAKDVSVLAFEKGMMAAEIFWYKQMREHTSIKVPKVYFEDFTQQIIPADYFIMEKLEGKTLDKIQLSADEKQQSLQETAKMVAQIHKVKSDQFGYVQTKLYDNWYLAIRSRFEDLIQDCKNMGKKSKRGEKMIKLIDKHKSVLIKAECCMVNFDVWSPNIMCQRENGKINYAWIDPERSFWGDRIVDFVCLEMEKPLDKKEKTLAAYNKVASASVNATQDEKIRYAVAQAYMGMIMETEKYYRYTPRHFGWWRNVLMSAWLFRQAFNALIESNKKG